MPDFLITVSDSQVEVSRIINEKLEHLKFKGERYLCRSDFWPVFKEKIEYEENEKLAIVMITSDQDFAIDKTINISESFETSQKGLISIINQYTKKKVCLYPNIDLKLTPLNENKQELPSINDENVNSIQAFYKKKTLEFKKGV